MPSITDVSRKWAAAGTYGKGIRLTDEELDILNAIGLGELLMSVAAAEQKEQAVERRALRDRTDRCEAGVPSPSPERIEGDGSSGFETTSTEQHGSHVKTTYPPRSASASVERRDDNLLRIVEVRRRTGLSVATIYRRGNEKTFTPKVRLGPKSVAWYESAVDAFVANPASYFAGDTAAGSERTRNEDY
jgi:prophage regulatory protein